MKAILMSCNNCNEEYAYDAVKEYIKPDMKVLCVPFASELNWQLKDDRDEYMMRHYNVFKSFGVPEENIAMASIKDKRSVLIEKFTEADIVFFSGGYMENLLYLIHTLNLKFIMTYIKHTKLIMGESAGALALLDEYVEVPFIEDAYKDYVIRKGLDFIDSYNIIVHYREWDRNHHVNREIVSTINEKPTVCLTDKALMIVDEKEVKFVGDYKI